MPEPTPVANPFALMMNPEDVLQAMARSDRLERLQRRICRPLDKPALGRGATEVQEFDKALDAQPGEETDF